MKLSKDDIKNFATEDEQKELTEAKKKPRPKAKASRRPTKQNNIFLIFTNTMYVEDFEESFLGAYTDGESAYKAAEKWSNKNPRVSLAFTIYQIVTNTGVGKYQAEDVTQDLEDLYGAVDEEEDESRTQKPWQKY